MRAGRDTRVRAILALPEALVARAQAVCATGAVPRARIWAAGKGRIDKIARLARIRRLAFADSISAARPMSRARHRTEVIHCEMACVASESCIALTSAFEADSATAAWLARHAVRVSKPPQEQGDHPTHPTNIARLSPVHGRTSRQQAHRRRYPFGVFCTRGLYRYIQYCTVQYGTPAR